MPGGSGAGGPIDVLAPAKLTLSLRMTGLRDDGYHLIDAEMVTLSLADRLEIEATDGETSIELIPRDGVDEAPIPLDEDNLVAKALRLAGRTARVRLHKTIPAGAGLGGGSADAAAVLRWAGFTDLEAAAGIGADVAFCVVGGRARVQGIGEIIEPLGFEKRVLTEGRGRGSGEATVGTDKTKQPPDIMNDIKEESGVLVFLACIFICLSVSPSGQHVLLQ